MSTQYTQDNGLGADRTATDKAGHDAAVAEIISRLTRGWSISEKFAESLPESDDWYPPNRPRRGCEDC